MSGILTQDKTTFVNAEHIALINARYDVSKNIYNIAAHKEYDDSYPPIVLGEYNTYERAIDVHEKLCTAIFNNNENIYIMPER